MFALRGLLTIRVRGNLYLLLRRSTYIETYVCVRVYVCGAFVLRLQQAQALILLLLLLVYCIKLISRFNGFCCCHNFDLALSLPLPTHCSPSFFLAKAKLLLHAQSNTQAQETTLSTTHRYKYINLCASKKKLVSKRNRTLIKCPLQRNERSFFTTEILNSQ